MFKERITRNNCTTEEHQRMWNLVERATLAVELARLSYEKKISIVHKNIFSRLTSANCYVLQSPTMQEVVFTGSNALLDWVYNCLPIPVKYGKGWVHWGFALAHKSIWRKVRKELDPRKPVLFIGHSAGGALASLSCDFADVFAGAGFITFGKPNLRTKKKPHEYHSHAHLFVQLSVVNYGDGVATIPRLLFGPHPEQDILYRDRHGQTHFNCTQEFRDKDRKIGKFIKGHFIAHYVGWLNDLNEVCVWDYDLPADAANDPEDLEKSA